MDVVELDGRGSLGDVDGVGGVGDQGLQVEDLEDPLEADDGRDDVHRGVGQRCQRTVEAGEQQRQRDDRSRVQPAVEGEPPAQSVDQCERQGGHERQRVHEHAHEQRGAHPDAADPPGTGRELRRFRGGPTEQLDQGRPTGVEPLGHLVVHRRVEVRGLASESCQTPADVPGGEQEDRQQEDRQHGDLPVDAGHHRQGEDQLHQVGHDPGEGVGEGPLGTHDVVVEATDQGAGAGPHEECHRHRLYVVEHRATQVEDQALADARRPQPGEHGRDRLDDADRGDQYREPDDHPNRRGLDDRGHDPAREHGGQDRQRRPEDGEDEEDDDPPGVGARELPDPAEVLAGEDTPVERDAVVLGPVQRPHGGHVHGQAGPLLSRRSRGVPTTPPYNPAGARPIPARVGDRGSSSSSSSRPSGQRPTVCLDTARVFV